MFAVVAYDISTKGPALYGPFSREKWAVEWAEVYAPEPYKVLPVRSITAQELKLAQDHPELTEGLD